MDPAMMVYYYDSGDVGAMIVLHVDDIMIASDSTKCIEKLVNAIHTKYPFGEWVEVWKTKNGIQYTGRNISVHGN